jgi:solute carrier family 50 protein (sugar transporter)
LFALQPFPTIQQVEKDKSVGPLPLLPYSSMIANCFLWLAYGMMKHEYKIWVTNLIGLLLGTYYFLIFIKYAPHKSPTLPGSIQQHTNACLAVVLGTFGFVFLSPFNNPAEVIGNIAVIFCVAMFASPLAALKTVLVTRSAESIPLPFSIATVMNCFLWSILGLFDMHDFNVYFPNLLGLAFGLAQVGLKLTFGDGSGKPGPEKLDLIA